MRWVTFVGCPVEKKLKKSNNFVNSRTRWMCSIKSFWSKWLPPATWGRRSRYCHNNGTVQCRCCILNPPIQNVFIVLIPESSSNLSPKGCSSCCTDGSSLRGGLRDCGQSKLFRSLHFGLCIFIYSDILSWYHLLFFLSWGCMFSLSLFSSSSVAGNSFSTCNNLQQTDLFLSKPWS